MKLREHLVVKCDSCTITVMKDKAVYKSTYSVCLFGKGYTSKMTCNSRTEAKKEFIRLLKLYTNLRISEILTKF